MSSQATRHLSESRRGGLAPLGRRISAWLAERRAVLAVGGRFGDFKGHAVHFVAVEEDVGGVGAVGVEGEVDEGEVELYELTL